MADPRAGYCEYDVNINWFFTYLDERCLELIQNEIDEIDEYVREQREDNLHLAIQTAAAAYIDYAVFGNKNTRCVFFQDFTPSNYESVWDAMYEAMDRYITRYPDHYTLREIQ